MFGRVVSCIDPITGEPGKTPETLSGPIPGVIDKLPYGESLDYPLVITNIGVGEGYVGTSCVRPITYNPACEVGTDEFDEPIIKGVLKVDCIKAGSIEGADCSDYLKKNEVDDNANYDIPLWDEDKATGYSSQAVSTAYPLKYNPNTGTLKVCTVDSKDLGSIGCHCDVSLADPIAPYSVLRYNPSTQQFESVQQVGTFDGMELGQMVIATGCCGQVLKRTNNITTCRAYTGVAACSFTIICAVPPALNTMSVSCVRVCSLDTTSSVYMRAGYGDYYEGAEIQLSSCTKSGSCTGTAVVDLRAHYKNNGPEQAGMYLKVCTSGIHFLHCAYSQYQPTSTACNFMYGYRFATQSNNDVAFEKYNATSCTWECAIKEFTIGRYNASATNFTSFQCLAARACNNSICFIHQYNINYYVCVCICNYSTGNSECVRACSFRGVGTFGACSTSCYHFSGIACICGKERQIDVYRMPGTQTDAEWVQVNPPVGVFAGTASSCEINVKAVL